MNNNSILDKIANDKNISKTNRSVKDQVIALRKKIIFGNDESAYTIIYLSDDEIQMIQNNVSVINIRSVTKNYIMTLYADYVVDIIDAKLIYIDPDQLGEKTQERYKLYLSVAEEAVREFNGNFTRLKSHDGSVFIKNMINKYGISKKLIWRTIRRYLQSGFDKNSLYDKRIMKKSANREYKVKPGRKNKYTEFGKMLTEEDKKIMNKFVNKYKSNAFSSVPQCYKDMIGAYYTIYVKNDDGSRTPEIMSPNEIPSLTQFRYYLNKKLSAKDKEMIEAKRKDISQGNASLNNADALYNVYGPTTVVEMDEQEMDLSAVSYVDPSLCIGRFIDLSYI